MCVASYLICFANKEKQQLNVQIVIVCTLHIFLQFNLTVLRQTFRHF